MKSTAFWCLGDYVLRVRQKRARNDDVRDVKRQRNSRIVSTSQHVRSWGRRGTFHFQWLRRGPLSSPRRHMSRTKRRPEQDATVRRSVRGSREVHDTMKAEPARQCHRTPPRRRAGRYLKLCLRQLFVAARSPRSASRLGNSTTSRICTRSAATRCQSRSP